MKSVRENMKEVSEMTYEIRVDYSDGYEIVRVVAQSIEAALAQTRAIANSADSVRLLGMIDSKPQTFLAY